MSLRAGTISGERAMERAEQAAIDMLDMARSEIERSYIATGLLAAVLPALTAGVSRAAAAATLRELLAEIEGRPH